MSDIKTFRAVEQGFHQGRLIQAEATFTVDLDLYKDETGDDFKPNWAVEVSDDHAATPDNAGEQEAMNLVPANQPVIERPDQPLPQFHPTAEVTPAAAPVQSEAAKLAVEQANAENGDKSVPVKTTAEILAEQAAAGTPAVEAPSPKPRRSRRKPDANSIDTGTDASDAQKEEAAEASEAEVEAADAAETPAEDHDEGNEFV